MTYDPRLVRLSKVSGTTMLGWTFRLGLSQLGQTTGVRTGIEVSSIDIADGFEVGPAGELSIDPMTGTASFTERFRPGVTDTVINQVNAPLAPDDRIEISYGQAVVHQAAVTKVDWHMEATGANWIRKTSYEYSGSAGVMLANVATWPFLPEEGVLTRLARFFNVNTSLLPPGQVAYLNTVLMPGTNAGSSTYLELARAFTAKSLYPLRGSTSPERWREVTIIPAVNYAGVPPAAVITNAEQWASAADFTTSVGVVRKPTDIDVKRNFDSFISGVRTETIPGASLGSFRLGSSRLGASFQVPIGIQVPIVIDAFGTILVASRVNHSFTSQNYRSALELVEPVKVG